MDLLSNWKLWTVFKRRTVDNITICFIGPHKPQFLNYTLWMQCEINDQIKRIYISENYTEIIVHVWMGINNKNTVVSRITFVLTGFGLHLNCTIKMFEFENSKSCILMYISIINVKTLDVKHYVRSVQRIHYSKNLYRPTVYSIIGQNMWYIKCISTNAKFQYHTIHWFLFQLPWDCYLVGCLCLSVQFPVRCRTTLIG